MLKAIGSLDLAVFQWLRSTYQSPGLDIFMAGLSDIARGSAVWVGLAALAGLMYRSRWPAVVQVILALAVTHFMTDVVAKPYFNRARPFESYSDTRVYGYKPTTRSLPSGHAANAIAAAYTLTRLAPDARAIFWTLAILIAFSRTYLGVHYPTDVLAGSLLGFGVAAFVVGGTRWGHGVNESEKEKVTSEK